MSAIKSLTVSGTKYDLKDETARTSASTALNKATDVETALGKLVQLTQ